MVRMRFQEVARSRGIQTIKGFREATGLAYDTAAGLWHGRIKRIDTHTLEKVCKALNCTLSDVMEVTADEQWGSGCMAHGT